MKRIVSLAAIIACTGVLVCGATKKNVKANENPFMAPYTAKYEIPPFEKIKLAHYLPALEAGRPLTLTYTGRFVVSYGA